MQTSNGLNGSSARTNFIKENNILPTAIDSQPVHKINLERLQTFGMPEIAIEKDKFDISDDCANEIIRELRTIVDNPKDESSAIELVEALTKYKDGLAAIRDTSHYPHSMDIKQELDDLILKLYQKIG